MACMPRALLLAMLVGAARAALSAERLAAIAKLKDELHTLTPAQTKQRFAELGAVHRLSQPPPRQSKIDHFVVLYQENRAFDHVFGCMMGDRPGADGIPTGGRILNKVPGMPHLGTVNVTCGTADYVCHGGGGYSTFSGKFGPAGALTGLKYPYAKQSDEFSFLNGAHDTAIQMFSREQLPVKASIMDSFGVFNKLYCASPTASTPNHHFTQTGTSCGSTNNNDYTDCGGKTLLFPQMSMYDTMWLDNVSFAWYMNSTCDSTEQGRGEKPCNSVGPHTDTSPVYAPDASLAGVARYTDRFYSHTQFYKDAAAGELPSFSWLNCVEEAADHPCSDMAKGERCQKDIYEALRAGPKWGNTLLVIVYDDAGGFYDQAVPPFEGVPDDEAPCQAPCRSFDFRRLGLRTSGMAISPWIAKGDIFQEPQPPFGEPGRSPFNTSQFELTSVAGTVKHLFNLSMFLTKRDAWAGNFEELLLDKPRPDADTPMHLPDAPTPAVPWGKPPAALPSPYPASDILPLCIPSGADGNTCTSCATQTGCPHQANCAGHNCCLNGQCRCSAKACPEATNSSNRSNSTLVALHAAQRAAGCTENVEIGTTCAPCKNSTQCPDLNGCGGHSCCTAGFCACSAHTTPCVERRAMQGAELGAAPLPQHCSLKDQTCRGLGVVNVRQKRFIKLYSRLTLSPEPNYAAMDFDAAEVWLAGLHRQWVKQGSPLR